MATKILPPITPTPGQIQFVDSPWQGQGLDTWSALVSNYTAFPILIGVAASTIYLGPYQQDYFDLPAGVYTFAIITQPLGTLPGGSTLGEILITAFDQSSDYDGQYPVALTPPTLEQTFSLIATGSIGPGTPSGDLEATGIMNQPFDAVIALCCMDLEETHPTAPVFVQLRTQLSPGPTPIYSTDRKGRFSSGQANLSTVGAGTVWFLDQDGETGADDVITYFLYGVTIANADALMATADTASGSFALGFDAATAYFEPDVRGRRTAKLALEYTYTGPVQFILDTDGVSRVLLDDATTDTVTGAMVIPDQEAWQIRVVYPGGPGPDIGGQVNITPVAG